MSRFGLVYFLLKYRVLQGITSEKYLNECNNDKKSVFVYAFPDGSLKIYFCIFRIFSQTYIAIIYVMRYSLIILDLLFQFRVTQYLN